MTFTKPSWQTEKPRGERKGGPLAQRERQYRRWPLMAVIVAGAWLGGAPSAYSLPVCDPTTRDISACCKITHSAVYQLTQDVQATRGGDCIRITAPGVTLDLHGWLLNGVTSATSPVGTGIHVLAAARAAIVVYGYNGIEDFATGIQNDAAKAIFYDLAISSNGGNGVVNNGPKALFWAVNSTLNGKNGIVNNASGAMFSSVHADDNDGNGIVLRSPPSPAPPNTDVYAYNFHVAGNLGNGLVLRRAVGDEVVGFYAYNNHRDGVLVRAGGGNLIYNCTAGYPGTPTGNAEYGLEIKSSNGNSILSSATSENSQGGVRIASSAHNSFVNLYAYSNTGAGIWLDGASHNTVNASVLCGNTTSGAYLGCSPSTLPSATSCGAAPHSNGNVLLGNRSQSNAIGIGIDKGNHGNQVILSDSVIASTTPCNGANSTYDLEDDNRNCDSNIWFHNGFTTSLPASPGCIN